MATKRYFRGRPEGAGEPETSDSEGLDSEEDTGIQQEPLRNPSISVKKITTNITNSEKQSSSISIAEFSKKSAPQVNIRTEAKLHKSDNKLQLNDEATKDQIDAVHEFENNSASTSDSDTDSSSDSESDLESSSDSDTKLQLKPVFISKSRRAENLKTLTPEEKLLRNKDRTLKKIELHIQQDIDYRKQQLRLIQDFDGIDDTDGLDPEAEYAQWELRSLGREERDRSRLTKEQEEFEELEERRMRTEEERDTEDKLKAQRVDEKKKLYSSTGAFFKDEALLNRNVEGEIEKYDKSLLPQRYHHGSK
ncbi:hypothetical protein WICMUC_003645 [Wickerhamomyces mucosus]|uniref:Micro-fibrillar-associated protein 1 C-terminal domain-containing protein n=1 Tax=Wickerhamomyces mucosus TaxID=1378264 RepID=A0A9P8PJY4_9ASCO|nr:hypothetical protein WICMUC_003645 [Wickerhamomyces mucosus]